ncbi:MAG: LamG domain-containing protein, partial [Prevotellaceae bacterium]|nr:LamG domain-containing protein [Prevotellaceae bacterium]
GATGKCVVTVEGFPEPVGVWTFSDPNDPTKAEIGQPLESVGGGFTPASGYLTVAKGSYGKALHGIAANGGGSRVNEYTLLIDFRIPSTGQWYALFQTNLNNDGDASCFIHPSNRNIGVGSTGYYGSVDAGVWYRFIVAAKLGTSYNYYLDGTRLNSKTDAGIDNNSFSLSPDGVLLFADNDGEDSDIDVSTVKIWNRQLTDEQVSTLGTAE